MWFEQTFREKLEEAATIGKTADVQQAIQNTNSREVEEARATRADGNGVNADVGIYRAYKDSSAVSIFSTVDECRYYQISVCY